MYCEVLLILCFACVFFADEAEQVCGGNDCGYPSSYVGYAISSAATTAQGASAAGGEQEAAATTRTTSV